MEIGIMEILKVFLIICIIGGLKSFIDRDTKWGNHARAARWLQKGKDLFDTATKRFLKAGYPYAQYIEAFAFAKKKGYIKRDLSEEEMNFYLSYPKRFQITNYDVKYIEHITSNSFKADDAIISVNGICLGKLAECPIFIQNDLVRSFSKNHLLWSAGNDLYIDDYVINSDYTHIISEEGARKSSEEELKRVYGNHEKAYKKIEKEAKEYLENGKEYITKDLQTFLDDIKNHDYTLQELKDLYTKNNKKWQDQYFKIDTETRDHFFEAYKDDNRYDFIYSKNSIEFQYGDGLYNYKDTQDIQGFKDYGEMDSLLHANIKRKSLIDKYRYIIEDHNKEYDIKDLVK